MVPRHRYNPSSTSVTASRLFFLFARPLSSIIRSPQSPRTRSLLAAYAFAVSLHTVAFGSFRCYIAFPHTAAFGTVHLFFFRSLLTHPFADFSHTIACGSFRLFGSLAYPFAGFSQTTAYGSFRLFAVLHTVAFGSTCLFAIFLHKVAFGSVCSAVLPCSHSWQLPLCAALPHTITLRQHSLFVTILHTAAQTALALHSPLTHGRSRERLLFAILAYTVALAALTICSLPEHGCFCSTRSSTFLQSSCIQSLVAAFASAAFSQTASWHCSQSHTRFLLAAFVFRSLLVHGCFSSIHSPPAFLQSSCTRLLVAAFAFATFSHTAAL